MAGFGGVKPAFSWEEKLESSGLFSIEPKPGPGDSPFGPYSLNFPLGASLSQLREYCCSSWRHTISP